MMTGSTPVSSWEQDVRNSADQLRYLTIAAYVYAAFTALGLLFLIGFLLIGSSAVFMDGLNGNGNSDVPQIFAGSVMIVGAVIAIVVCVLQFLFARWLQVQRNYTGAIILAAITCLNMPFGTALGIWALIVLTRTPTKALFQRHTYAG
jgi:hypothetical protein